MAGRPRKPTALRILQGNAGKRPLPKGEPTPAVGCPKPTNLTKRAAAIWDRLTPVYEGQGVLTEMDGSAFATLCELQAEFDRRKRKKPPEVSVTLAKTLHAFYTQFGGTPSSRTRISVEPKKPDSKLARFGGGA